jgi:HPt (histidine-containing phosphotransfer) domain-containing protein
VTDPQQDQILDQDVVRALKELGGDEEPELFAELVTMFLDDTPGRLASLMEALEHGDAGTVERTAHALKSSCGNLGARRLAALCFEIESAGRAGDLETARPLVGRSRAEFTAVSDALRAELA